MKILMKKCMVVKKNRIERIKKEEKSLEVEEMEGLYSR
jgi:hypothetical protein